MWNKSKQLRNEEKQILSHYNISIEYATIFWDHFEAVLFLHKNISINIFSTMSDFDGLHPNLTIFKYLIVITNLWNNSEF